VRRGFSFIELVVSIVVIGIAFMSIPLVLRETEKTLTLSIQQEAVMAGITQMVNIMSYRWDEQNTDDARNGGSAKVLDTFNTTALECNNYSGSRRRIGHFIGNLRRRCYNTQVDATPIANLGSDSNDMDDIDDIIASNSSLLTGTTNHTTDYKNSYTFDLNVEYVNDNLGLTNFSQAVLTGSISTTSATIPTSIKMVTLTISSPQTDNTIRLRAFAANIGEVQYLSRPFQ